MAKNIKSFYTASKGITPPQKNEEKKKEENAKTKTTVAKTGKRKVSKTWEAMQRLKGSLIVNDPKFLL